MLFLVPSNAHHPSRVSGTLCLEFCRSFLPFQTGSLNTELELPSAALAEPKLPPRIHPGPDHRAPPLRRDATVWSMLVHKLVSPEENELPKAESTLTHLVASTFNQFFIRCRHPTTWLMLWSYRMFSEKFLIKNK